MIKKRVINIVLTLLIIIYILFEELIWERFATPIIRYISSLRILQRVDKFLKKVDSRVVLVIFVLIFALVEIIGIYAGALFISGDIIKGVLLYATKIPIAAFTFWLFDVSKERLLEFSWFKKSYYFIIGLIDMIKNSSIYISVRSYAKNIKSKLIKDRSRLKEKAKFIYRKLKNRFSS